MKRSYFNLNENNELFEELSKNPLWWEKLKDVDNLYFNIRKNNRINVYYRGASIMSLSWKGGKIVADIHNYYLGYEKNICKELNIKYGNVTLQPKEILCRIPTIMKRVDANKKNVACLEGEEINGKNYSSEKYYQSEMYLKNNQYIDTEFAVSLDDGMAVRIDMVKVNERGEIQFEELKLIDDDRLDPAKYKNKEVEIIRQMDSYEQFLKEAGMLKGTENEPILIEYYNKVLRIMDKIGICRGEKRITGVSDYVQITIKQNYTIRHPKRDERVERVYEACRGFHSNIEEVKEEYYKL
jgi:hypothetical protein